MAEITRRAFLKGAGLAAAGLAAMQLVDKAAAFDYLTPINDPLGDYPYVYRAWESFYKNQWAFEHFGRCAHSANCTGNCTWKAFVRNGILFKEEQFADYPDIGTTVPTYNPRGCQKGANYKEYVYGPQRVKYPLIRTDYPGNNANRGKGNFRRATWDEALSLIASKVVSTINTGWNDGVTPRAASPDQLFFYAAIPAKHHITLSGGFRLANLLGAPVGSFYDWYCDNPPGEPMTWGVQTDACESADWYNSTFIMIQGANLLETRIPDAHYFHEARAKGCKTVVVAPEHSPVAIHADLFLPIKPGTDGALCLGMCNVVVNENLYQADYLKQFTDMPLLVYTSGPNAGKFVRTSQDPYIPGGTDPAFPGPRPNPLFNEFRAYVAGTGFVTPPMAALTAFIPELLPGALTYTDGQTVMTVFELLSQSLAAYSPAAVEGITGISAQTVIDMAHDFANNSGFATKDLPADQKRGGRIIEGAGTNHYYNNDLINRAQILILALTGNVGYPGCGFDHYVGQEKLWGEEGFFRMSFPNGRARQRFQPTTLWTYVHSGTTSDVDSVLPRPVNQYIADSVNNGWMPLWPKGTLANGRAPKVMFVWGANYVNQAKGQVKVLDTLLPKLDLLVDLNFQMDTSARYADVVLPAASYFEKFDINTSDMTTWVIPFTPVIDPLYESRTDWQIWRSLAQAIQSSGFAGFTDDFAPFGGNHWPTGLAVPAMQRDFTTLVTQYDTWASPDGTLSPNNYPPINTIDVANDRDACQFLLDSSPEMAGSPPVAGTLTIKHPGLEGNPVGDYRFTGPAQLDALPAGSIIKHPQRFIAASEEWTSEIIPDVPYYAFQRMTELQHPLKTQTGRQQFYLDHLWMLELGEQLPVHRGPIDVDRDPATGDPYPLRWITPHGRWSIHSTWRNAKFQLRLQRGRPVVYLSPAEAAARDLLDNDLVTVRNNHGSLDAHLYISPRMPDGMAMMYHGWEAYTVPGGVGWQSPVGIRIKPTQLIGRYGQMNFRLNYFGPTGNQKDTLVQIELKLREPDNSMAPWPA